MCSSAPRMAEFLSRDHVMPLSSWSFTHGFPCLSRLILVLAAFVGSNSSLFPSHRTPVSGLRGLLTGKISPSRKESAGHNRIGAKIASRLDSLTQYIPVKIFGSRSEWRTKQQIVKSTNFSGGASQAEWRTQSAGLRRGSGPDLMRRLMD
jgi:hypothetical protein